jgi:hypothetical protein
MPHAQDYEIVNLSESGVKQLEAIPAHLTLTSAQSRNEWETNQRQRHFLVLFPQYLVL